MSDRIGNVVKKGRKYSAVYQHLTFPSDYSRPRKRAGRYEKGAGRKKRFKFLPNGKIVDWFKFKAFANGKLNVVRIMISVSDRVENIVGKGENAGYQHFLLFLQCSQKASFSGSFKVGIVW